MYLLKANNENARAIVLIWSKLTIKRSERRDRRRSCVFNVKFEHVAHIDLVFPLFHRGSTRIV